MAQVFRPSTVFALKLVLLATVLVIAVIWVALYKALPAHSEAMAKARSCFCGIDVLCISFPNRCRFFSTREPRSILGATQINVNLRTPFLGGSNNTRSPFVSFV